MSRFFYSSEYVALVGSFILVGLESFIRVLTLALRASPKQERNEEYAPC
jgi:hypothetical protein